MNLKKRVLSAVLAASVAVSSLVGLTIPASADVTGSSYKENVKASSAVGGISAPNAPVSPILCVYPIPSAIHDGNANGMSDKIAENQMEQVTNTKGTVSFEVGTGSYSFDTYRTLESAVWVRPQKSYKKKGIEKEDGSGYYFETSELTSNPIIYTDYSDGYFTSIKGGYEGIKSKLDFNTVESDKNTNAFANWMSKVEALPEEWSDAAVYTMQTGKQLSNAFAAYCKGKTSDQIWEGMFEKGYLKYVKDSSMRDTLKKWHNDGYGITLAVEIYIPSQDYNTLQLSYINLNALMDYSKQADKYRTGILPDVESEVYGAYGNVPGVTAADNTEMTYALYFAAPRTYLGMLPTWNDLPASDSNYTKSKHKHSYEKKNYVGGGGWGFFSFEGGATESVDLLLMKDVASTGAEVPGFDESQVTWKFMVSEPIYIEGKESDKLASLNSQMGTSYGTLSEAILGTLAGSVANLNAANTSAMFLLQAKAGISITWNTGSSATAGPAHIPTYNAAKGFSTVKTNITYKTDAAHKGKPFYILIQEQRGADGNRTAVKDTYRWNTPTTAIVKYTPPTEKGEKGTWSEFVSLDSFFTDESAEKASADASLQTSSSGTTYVKFVNKYRPVEVTVPTVTPIYPELSVWDTHTYKVSYPDNPELGDLANTENKVYINTENIYERLDGDGVDFAVGSKFFMNVADLVSDASIVDSIKTGVWGNESALKLNSPLRNTSYTKAAETSMTVNILSGTASFTPDATFLTRFTEDNYRNANVPTDFDSSIDGTTSENSAANFTLLDWSGTTGKTDNNSVTFDDGATITLAATEYSYPYATGVNTLTSDTEVSDALNSYVAYARNYAAYETLVGNYNLDIRNAVDYYTEVARKCLIAMNDIVAEYNALENISPAEPTKQVAFHTHYTTKDYYRQYSSSYFSNSAFSTSDADLNLKTNSDFDPDEYCYYGDDHTHPTKTTGEAGEYWECKYDSNGYIFVAKHHDGSYSDTDGTAATPAYQKTEDSADDPATQAKNAYDAYKAVATLFEKVTGIKAESGFAYSSLSFDEDDKFTITAGRYSNSVDCFGSSKYTCTINNLAVGEYYSDYDYKREVKGDAGMTVPTDKKVNTKFTMPTGSNVVGTSMMPSGLKGVIAAALTPSMTAADGFNAINTTNVAVSGEIGEVLKTYAKGVQAQAELERNRPHAEFSFATDYVWNYDPTKLFSTVTVPEYMAAYYWEDETPFTKDTLLKSLLDYEGKTKYMNNKVNNLTGATSTFGSYTAPEPTKVQTYMSLSDSTQKYISYTANGAISTAAGKSELVRPLVNVEYTAGTKKASGTEAKLLFNWAPYENKKDTAKKLYLLGYSKTNSTAGAINNKTAFDAYSYYGDSYSVWTSRWKLAYDKANDRDVLVNTNQFGMNINVAGSDGYAWASLYDGDSAGKYTTLCITGSGTMNEYIGGGATIHGNNIVASNTVIKNTDLAVYETLYQTEDGIEASMHSHIPQGVDLTAIATSVYSMFASYNNAATDVNTTASENRVSTWQKSLLPYLLTAQFEYYATGDKEHVVIPYEAVEPEEGMDGTTQAILAHGHYTRNGIGDGTNDVATADYSIYPAVKMAYMQPTNGAAAYTYIAGQKARKLYGQVAYRMGVLTADGGPVPTVIADAVVADSNAAISYGGKQAAYSGTGVMISYDPNTSIVMQSYELINVDATKSYQSDWGNQTASVTGHNEWLASMGAEVRNVGTSGTSLLTLPYKAGSNVKIANKADATDFSGAKEWNMTTGVEFALEDVDSTFSTDSYVDIKFNVAGGEIVSMTIPAGLNLLGDKEDAKAYVTTSDVTLTASTTLEMFRKLRAPDVNLKVITEVLKDMGINGGEDDLLHKTFAYNEGIDAPDEYAALRCGGAEGWYNEYVNCLALRFNTTAFKLNPLVFSDKIPVELGPSYDPSRPFSQGYAFNAQSLMLKLGAESEGSDFDDHTGATELIGETWYLKKPAASRNVADLIIADVPVTAAH